MKIAIFFHRLGPYHVARLNALSDYSEVFAFEGVKEDDIYAWDIVDTKTRMHVCTLFPDDIALMKAGSTVLYGKIKKRLNHVKPDVVAVNGWASPLALSAFKWCKKKKIPVVMMSDSTAHDTSRIWYKEKIKSRIIRLSSAGLVGGEPHAEYLKALGMSEEFIFRGYDVVDNEYFSRSSRLIGNDNYRPYLSNPALPGKYIFSCSRFVEKKNLEGLIKGYAGYKALAGKDSHKLVLAGDGPLMARLKGLVQELSLESDVIFPGFLQYKELPSYFGSAQFFVHASTVEQWGLVVNEAMASGLPVLVSRNCGCVPDLVQEGLNGFTFDPLDEKELARLMLMLSSVSDDQKIKMAQKSSDIICNWSPETFACNLKRAAETALSRPIIKAGLMDRVILNILTLSTIIFSKKFNEL